MELYKRIIKIVIITFTLIISTSIAQATSVTGTIEDNGVLDYKTTWYQEVQADNTGIVNFTIYLYDWNNLPEPEWLTAEVIDPYDNNIRFTESLWYTDVGHQKLTFTWNNDFTVVDGEWYLFSIKGSDDIPNRALNFTFNTYIGDLYCNTGYVYTPNYDLIYDLIFDNHTITTTEEPSTAILLFFGVVLILCSYEVGKKRLTS